MPTYVALLAGINLGKRRIKMAALQSHFEDLGFEAVQTILASGNVILDSKTFVRTPDELAQVINNSPFTLPGDKADGFSVQVQFFKEPLSKKMAAQVSKIRTATDQFEALGRELYWRLSGRMSDSIVWNSNDLKAVGLPAGTTRNTNTVVKLLESLSNR
jgi:uncharacterized protein (DUF1697 family)